MLVTVAVALGGAGPDVGVADLEAAVDALEARYIRPERVQSSEFREQVRVAREALSAADDPVESWRVLSRLIASLEDGHTAVDIPPYASRMPYLDASIRLDHAGTFRVRRASGESVVVAIDGKDAAELVSELEMLFSGETVAYRRYTIDPGFEQLYPWLFQSSGPVVLTLEGGDTVEVEVVPPDPPGGDGGSAPSYEWSHDGALSVLRIDDFEFAGGRWGKTLKKGLRTANKRGSEALVLDVRGNEGGDSAHVSRLLPHLMAPWRVYSSQTARRPEADGSWSDPVTTELKPRNVRFLPQWDGPVYVLTDGGTFSTACDLAAALSDHGRAKIVGAAPGGLPTSSGQVSYLTLPSGLGMRVATGSVVRADPTRGEGPLEVDVAVPPAEALDAVRAMFR